MKYVSLIHALNIPCSLETCGDWHASGIQWKRPHILESDYSLWSDYGILYSKELLEALFFEFYTKIPYIQEQLGVSDKTVQKYLDTLVELGFLTSEKIGRERIYKNERLFKIIKDVDRE